MFDGLFIASLIGSCYQVIKEAFEPTIPAENWANKELYHQDMMNGVSREDFLTDERTSRAACMTLINIGELVKKPNR